MTDRQPIVSDSARPDNIACWRCETCGTKMKVPAGIAEKGYFCCFASMTFVGVESPEAKSTAEPLIADSARLRPLDRRAIDLNEVAHEEYRARRKG